MATSLEVAAKYALLSFDATMRSNVTVGPPIDLLIYRKNSLHASRHRRLAAMDQDLEPDSRLVGAVAAPRRRAAAGDSLRRAGSRRSTPPARGGRGRRTIRAETASRADLLMAVATTDPFTGYTRRGHLRRDARRPVAAAQVRTGACTASCSSSPPRSCGAASSRRTSRSSTPGSPSPSTAARKGPSGSSRTICCRGSSPPPTGKSSSAA